MTKSNDWRLDILRRAYSDKDLNVNALKILMYLLTKMNVGERKYVPISEVVEEVGISAPSAASIAFNQLDAKGYILRVVSQVKKSRREVELVAA